MLLSWGQKLSADMPKCFLTACILSCILSCAHARQDACAHALQRERQSMAPGAILPAAVCRGSCVVTAG